MSWEKVILENQPALLDSFLGQYPRDSPNQVPEQAKVTWLLIFIFCLFPFSEDPELYHLMITAGKAPPDLHIPKQFFYVSNYDVQQGAFKWVLCVQA